MRTTRSAAKAVGFAIHYLQGRQSRPSFCTQADGRELRDLSWRASADGNAPHFVEVGEAGIAVDDATRRQRRVQLVG